MTLILGTPICLWCHSFYFLTAVLYSCSLHVYVLLYPCNDTRKIQGNCYGFVQQILGFEEKSKRSALDSYDSPIVKRKQSEGYSSEKKAFFISIWPGVHKLMEAGSGGGLLVVAVTVPCVVRTFIVKVIVIKRRMIAIGQKKFLLLTRFFYVQLRSKFAKIAYTTNFSSFRFGPCLQGFWAITFSLNIFQTRVDEFEYAYFFVLVPI